MLSLTLGSSCSMYRIILQLIFEVYAGGCDSSSFGANLVLRCDFPELTAESLGCSLGCLSPPCLPTLCEVSRHRSTHSGPGSGSWLDSMAASPQYTPPEVSVHAQGDSVKRPCSPVHSFSELLLTPEFWADARLITLGQQSFSTAVRCLAMTVPVSTSWIVFRMFICICHS